jgi:L-amino acid N-acyltransferase YncA
MRLTYYDHALEKAIATGVVDPLPGSSQVAVFHSSFVIPEERGKGAGWKAHEQRLRYAREQLFDYAICTVASSNDAQRNILLSYGWREVGEFLSKKTNHLVSVYGKEL